MKPDPLFHASAAIELPPGLDVDELRRALESIARELDIEYSLAVARA
jgi:glycine cleavage system regulatory protein